MNNIINTMENKKIINTNNPIRNKALEALLNFDMSDELVSVFRNLYYVCGNDVQMLIEIKNNDIKGIEIIDGNDKYTIINNSKEEKVGLGFTSSDSKPIFTTHFYSLKNDSISDYYDYMDIITRKQNIFEFNNKKKDNTKAIAK